MRFLRAAIQAGCLKDGNLRSYAEVLRLMVGVTPEGAPEPEAFPNMVRKYRRHYALSEGDDGERHYIFYAKEPFSVPERGIEEMKRAYTNKPEGLGWTINQVCTHFGMGRREFNFLRAQLGWTHDQDEFTREEHLELSTAQLLEDREQRSRWQLLQQAQRQELEVIIEKAKRWDHAVGRYLGETLPTLDVATETHTDIYEQLAVFPLADFHIESLRDAEAKVESFLELTRRVSWDASKAVLVFLGDWFNYDTHARTTTRGTLVGHENPEDMVRLAYSAARQIIEIAKGAFAEVTAVVVAGNHDRMQTIGFSIWLEDVIGTAPQMLQAVGGLELAQVTFGRSVLWFEHGDGGRGKIENIVMKAGAVFGRDPNKFHALYTGHLHHSKMVDIAGVLCFQLPAPKTLRKNDWEEKAGYHSNHGMRADVYCAENGLVGTYWGWM
jgi:hypothetical protein